MNENEVIKNWITSDIKSINTDESPSDKPSDKPSNEPSGQSVISFDEFIKRSRESKKIAYIVSNFKNIPNQKVKELPDKILLSAFLKANGNEKEYKKVTNEIVSDILNYERERLDDKDPRKRLPIQDLIKGLKNAVSDIFSYKKTAVGLLIEYKKLYEESLKLAKGVPVEEIDKGFSGPDMRYLNDLSTIQKQTNNQQPSQQTNKQQPSAQEDNSKPNLMKI